MRRRRTCRQNGFNSGCVFNQGPRHCSSTSTSLTSAATWTFRFKPLASFSVSSPLTAPARVISARSRRASVRSACATFGETSFRQRRSSRSYRRHVSVSASPRNLFQATSETLERMGFRFMSVCRRTFSNQRLLRRPRSRCCASPGAIFIRSSHDRDAWKRCAGSIRPSATIAPTDRELGVVLSRLSSPMCFFMRPPLLAQIRTPGAASLRTPWRSCAGF